MTRIAGAARLPPDYRQTRRFGWRARPTAAGLGLRVHSVQTFNKKLNLALTYNMPRLLSLMQRSTGRSLSTFGCMEWESELYRGIMRARCCPLTCHRDITSFKLTESLARRSSSRLHDRACDRGESGELLSQPQ